MLLFNFFIPMRMREDIQGGGGWGECEAADRARRGRGKWMIELYVILQQTPIFVHKIAQELSSISGEERESETAGECYLVVVKGCPGSTARHSTTYSTYSTLSHRNYYELIVSSSE